MATRIDSPDLQRALRRIRARREEMALTQTEHARRVGIGPDYLRRIERCESDPGVGALLAIVEELGVTMGVMFADEESEAAAT